MTTIEQMNANIEKMRKDIKSDCRRVALQTYTTLTVAFLAGVAAFALYLRLDH